MHFSPLSCNQNQKCLLLLGIRVLWIFALLFIILQKDINDKFACRTTINYYLVNLSIADLMITAWCPIHSLVKELSSQNQYVLPAIFCKIGVFYTGDTFWLHKHFIISFLFSPLHGIKCDDTVSHLLWQISCRHMSTSDKGYSEEGEVWMQVEYAVFTKIFFQIFYCICLGFGSSCCISVSILQKDYWTKGKSQKS